VKSRPEGAGELDDEPSPCPTKSGKFTICSTSRTNHMASIETDLERARRAGAAYQILPSLYLVGSLEQGVCAYVNGEHLLLTGVTPVSEYLAVLKANAG
jgi:hypothetical protein